MCSYLPEPRSSISVIHPIEPNQSNGLPSDKWITIRDFAFSASGKYVATLSYANDMVYVDLWDVGPDAMQGPGTWKSQKSASRSWKCVGTNYSVSVSSCGSQVAVSCTEMGNSDPKKCFHLLTTDCASTFTQSGPRQLECSAKQICNELLGLIGVGKFFLSGNDEQFIFCDGFNAFLYSTKSWDQLHTFTLSCDWEPSTHLFSTRRSPPPAEVPFLSSSGKCFLWYDYGRVYVWHLETGSIISMLSWGSLIKHCSFLAFDDHTIAVEIDGNMALFAAATGELLNICPVPDQPTIDGPSIPMRWMYPTDMSSLARPFDVGFASSVLATSGCWYMNTGYLPPITVVTRHSKDLLSSVDVTVRHWTSILRMMWHCSWMGQGCQHWKSAPRSANSYRLRWGALLIVSKRSGG